VVLEQPTIFTPMFDAVYAQAAKVVSMAEMMRPSGAGSRAAIPFLLLESILPIMK